MGESNTANLRASDEDRNRVADELRGHCASGRITVEELDERVGRAMVAVTLGDLEPLVADLPRPATTRLPTPVLTATQLAPLEGRGIRTFSLRYELPVPVERARGAVLGEIGSAMSSHGFGLVHQSPTDVAFLRQPNRTAAIILSVVLFPFGLIAFAFAKEQRVAVSLEPLVADRTAVTIHGVASRSVRGTLTALLERRA